MPYERFNKEELILRDELAIDRTLLANERTLLAYLRSAVALIIAGLSILNLSQTKWFDVFGIALIPSGVAAGTIGILRYVKMKKQINVIKRNIEED